MAANLDYSNNRVNFAFVGDREDIWHREGNQIERGQSIEQWSVASGLGHKMIRTPAFTQLPDGSFKQLPDWTYLTRNDTLEPLGYVSVTGYKEVQPITMLETLAQYTSVDDRFQLDAAGSLDGGRRIWATATFNGEMTVAGSKHIARLLATTSFDGTSATWFNATTTRVVCQNTLHASLADRRAQFRVYHSKQFDKREAGKELAKIAAGFDVYKDMAEAMALVHFGYDEAENLFRKLLDIPRDAKENDISTRKLNQFNSLVSAYDRTVNEGTEKATAWTVLNAVTRYVDHSRSSRSGDGVTSARFASAQFGSGFDMKAQAWNLLAPMVKDRVAA